MQARKPILPPSRAVLVILPLALIEQLDQAADTLGMNRSDVIRRSLVRDAAGALHEEVTRTRTQRQPSERPKYWSAW
jgi:metal-responsive CopG/Arc/MetJ family transcriptional regulator